MPARLEVITGPMFSGKSEQLISLLKRVRYAKKRALVLKPAIDHRSGASAIASREVDGGRSMTVARYPAVSIGTLDEFRQALSRHTFDVLAIDEAQFFTQSWFIREIEELLRKRARDDFRIIIAGLDLTAQLEPFGPIPQLLAMADEVDKLDAICMCCGAPAHFTKKIGGTSAQIEVGDTDLYQARCRPCHAED